jgi:hypothetical protein
MYVCWQTFDFGGLKMVVKTLKVGDKGKEVKALQEMLNDEVKAKLQANGEFGQ